MRCFIYRRYTALWLIGYLDKRSFSKSLYRLLYKLSESENNSVFLLMNSKVAIYCMVAFNEHYLQILSNSLHRSKRDSVEPMLLLLVSDGK